MSKRTKIKLNELIHIKQLEWHSIHTVSIRSLLFLKHDYSPPICRRLLQEKIASFAGRGLSMNEKRLDLFAVTVLLKPVFSVRGCARVRS